MHWRRKWQPTPVFLPGESQGWGSLVRCRLWGRTESDTTEATQQQQQQQGDIKGFPGGARGKQPACRFRRCRRRGLDPCVGKIPWRRTRQPTPVFLRGESHGQRSLAGYSPRGHAESDTTDATSHAWTHCVYASQWKMEFFPLRVRTRHGRPLLPFLFNVA